MKLKYRKNQKVVVIREGHNAKGSVSHGHQFEKNEIVRIKEKIDDNSKDAHYCCEKLDGSDFWWLDEIDLKLQNKTK